MPLTGKIVRHLTEADLEARERVEILVLQMKEKQRITEQMKAEDQMLRVGRMNNIYHAAEEVALQEIVYR